MKIKFLLVGLLGMISVTAFAQKGELKNAQDAYEKFQSLKAAQVGALATTSLNVAKVSIDKASANDKTSTLPLTYALKGAIYSDFAVADTAQTNPSLFTTAQEAFKKAQELDTKNENKALFDRTTLNIAQYNLNEGVRAYTAKKYDLAYNAFDRYRQIMPEDTNAIYYTGLAAINAGNIATGITQYNNLLTKNYSKNDFVYFELSNLYLMNKDTVGALKAASDGIAKYPKSNDLRKRQIELYLRTGKQQEVLNQIQTAINNDPKNKELYYYAGITYSQLAEAEGKEQSKVKDPAAKAKFQAAKVDYFTKSADMYKKALAIDPNFFEANLNLGYSLISPAIDMYNAANQLPANKQKEYEAAIAKSNEQFDLAKPYLLKAVDLNPKSADALSNLKTYYRAKNDMTNATAIQKRLDELQ
ncbi:MAG: hypothetical protein ABI367_13630 [Mucilaginibacter sp.]